MEPTSIFLLIILTIVGGFLVYRELNRGNTANHLEPLEKLLQVDKEDRNRDSDLLRKELRDTAETLRNEFFKMNRTVDSKLGESSKQLNSRLDKSSEVIGSLQKELGKMSEIGGKIEHLDKILRAPKGRGNMGEENLEEMLRAVFPSDMWERQHHLGTGMVVDFLVHTNNGDIPIDSKFPLSGFEKMMTAENESGAAVARKEFQREMKQHIDAVSKYIQPQVGTVSFAVLFLPNENIYYEASIRDSVIPEYAREKKVLLTGPNTMLYVLQIISKAYQSQRFAKKAQQALDQLAGVQKQAGKLDEELAVLGKHLGNANSKLNDTQQENTKLQNQIERVASMKSDVQDEKAKLL